MVVQVKKTAEQLLPWRMSVDGEQRLKQLVEVQFRGSDSTHFYFGVCMLQASF